jgi:hypothetical protein
MSRSLVAGRLQNVRLVENQLCHQQRLPVQQTKLGLAAFKRAS